VTNKGPLTCVILFVFRWRAALRAHEDETVPNLATGEMDMGSEAINSAQENLNQAQQDAAQLNDLKEQQLAFEKHQKEVEILQQAQQFAIQNTQA
jgi:hypothetical protein